MIVFCMISQLKIGRYTTITTPWLRLRLCRRLLLLLLLLLLLPLLKLGRDGFNFYN
jgi:hypothetical protein